MRTRDSSTIEYDSGLIFIDASNVIMAGEMERG
jgi:hypothetical protein